MMKKICRIVCLVLALSILAASMLGCEKEPGIYTWYGTKMKADNIVTVHVGTANGEKVYDVPFETYRTVFLYLKDHVADVIRDEKGNSTALATDAEKNAVIKEVAEDILIEYYSLVALAEQYGIAITDADKQAYYDDYQKKIQNFVDNIDKSELDYKGTKEEYAKELYEKSLKIIGTTPEYFEFSYYRSLLQTRLKEAIAPDLGDYLEQSYYHYKQVLISYTKGDAVAEENARTRISEAAAKLQNGESMDDVIKAYGDADSYKEIYFDAYGKVVGSSTGETLGSITVDTVYSLGLGEISGIISGDNDDYSGYFVILQRLGFDKSYICGSNHIAEIIYQYPYVHSEYLSPHYNRYLTLVKSFEQNTAIVPVDGKVYKEISIDSLY